MDRFVIYEDKAPFMDLDSIVLVPELKRLNAKTVFIQNLKIKSQDSLFLPRNTQDLTLNNTGLKQFNPTIDSKYLDKVLLPNNNIVEFPSWINSRIHIHHLSLRFNELSNFGILETKVQTLYLQQNNFDLLPEIKYLESLKNLIISDNVKVCGDNGNEILILKGALRNGKEIPLCS
jgi:hypothetical protein